MSPYRDGGDRVDPRPERDEEETTARVRVKLLAAFERNHRAYQEVGESMARWLADVRGRPVVLVVEDEEQILRQYRDAFGEECLVLEARDSVEAGDHVARADRIDLVVLDLVLPIGSGVDVARALRARWPLVPVLVVSAFIDRAVQVQLAEIGGPFEFHPKPDTKVGEWAKRHLTP